MALSHSVDIFKGRADWEQYFGGLVGGMCCSIDKTPNKLIEALIFNYKFVIGRL
jgi:hypothetical protein